MQTELPDRAWKRLVVDIFTLKGKMDWLVVDYYSRFIEIRKSYTIKVSKCDSPPKIDVCKT